MEDNSNVQVCGYEDVDIIGKFDKEGNMLQVSYDSHVAYSSKLMKEYMECMRLWRGNRD